MLEYDEILSLPDDVADVDAADDIRTIDEVLAASAASSAETASSEGGVLVDLDMIVRPEQFSRFFNGVEGQVKEAGFAGSGLKDESENLFMGQN